MEFLGFRTHNYPFYGPIYEKMDKFYPNNGRLLSKGNIYSCIDVANGIFHMFCIQHNQT